MNDNVSEHEELREAFSKIIPKNRNPGKTTLVYVALVSFVAIVATGALMAAQITSHAERMFESHIASVNTVLQNISLTTGEKRCHKTVHVTRNVLRRHSGDRPGG